MTPLLTCILSALFSVSVRCTCFGFLQLLSFESVDGDLISRLLSLAPYKRVISAAAEQFCRKSKMNKKSESNLHVLICAMQEVLISLQWRVVSVHRDGEGEEDGQKEKKEQAEGAIVAGLLVRALQFIESPCFLEEKHKMHE